MANNKEKAAPGKKAPRKAARKARSNGRTANGKRATVEPARKLKRKFFDKELE